MRGRRRDFKFPDSSRLRRIEFAFSAAENRM